MTTPDLLIKKLENENITTKEKLQVFVEVKQELERYESGDLIYFKNTAIPKCFKFYYDFYSQKLTSSQPA